MREVSVKLNSKELVEVKNRIRKEWNFMGEEDKNFISTIHRKFEKAIKEASDE